MANKNNNIPLNEMMEKTPRSGISMDLTKGPLTTIPTNEENEAPVTPINKPVVAPVHVGPVNMDNMSAMDINSILPKREKEVNPMESDLFDKLDAAVDRERESISKRVNAVTEAQRAEIEAQAAIEEQKAQDAEDRFALDGVETSTSIVADNSIFNGVEDDGDYYNTTTSDSAPLYTIDNANRINIDMDDTDDAPVAEDDNIIKPSVVKDTKVNILDTSDDDGLFDDEEEDAAADDGQTVNEMLEVLKTEVKNKITPIRKSLDLSKFSIAQKSISAQKVMKLAVQKHQHIADWIMYSAKRSISVTGLSGPEILKLNPENSNRNRLNTFRDMYRVIYEHVYDANKPDFETWLKQLRFVDLQHVYFALYMATFGGSNFVNYTCPSCKKVFIHDVKFEDMVKYADEEVRESVCSILKLDSTSQSNDTYDVDLIQISDSCVFALRSPSVWNVIIETASLSDKFLEKHSDLIDVVSYIDAIYMVDEESSSLIPIDTKPDANDQAKTSARRIKAFYDIISSLSSEDYYNLRSHINEYDERSSKVSYQIPACNCPDCNADIPVNENITPDNMLFTRHQLAAIGNM